MDINTHLVGRLVAEQLPQWANLPIAPVEPGGWDNRTFRLGTNMTVRLPSAERYACQVDKEQEWLPKLAPFLPLPVPVPLAMGAPAQGYPWRWSVYAWLEGESASHSYIDDWIAFATSLADFLLALQRIDAVGGPAPGRHNFFRGGPLATYDGEVRAAIELLGRRIDARGARELWEAGLRAAWHGGPVWLHGDVHATNLLVRKGRLSAVIDFGCSGVGDPACDLAIAWTLFAGASRDAFRERLGVDNATWARGRAWATWKALITLADRIHAKPEATEGARRTLEEALCDIRSERRIQ